MLDTQTTNEPKVPLIDAEAGARAVLADRLGRCLTKEEWATSRARLLAYVEVLKSWDLASRSSKRLG